MAMGLGDTYTRAKLIDPALHQRGSTQDHIKRKLTTGAIDIIEGHPKRRARVDYILRIRIGRLPSDSKSTNCQSMERPEAAS